MTSLVIPNRRPCSNTGTPVGARRQSEPEPVVSGPDQAVPFQPSGGFTLTPSLQTQMSALLGHDLSGVRIHTDAEADRAAKGSQTRCSTWGATFGSATGPLHKAPENPSLLNSGSNSTQSKAGHRCRLAKPRPPQTPTSHEAHGPAQQHIHAKGRAGGHQLSRRYDRGLLGQSISLKIQFSQLQPRNGAPQRSGIAGQLRPRLGETHKDPP